VEPIALLEADGTYDAAIAVVSLHHVEPLHESCEHLGHLVKPGGRLVIDEFDIERFDARAARWWLGQRAALGFEEEHEAEDMVAERRAHLHSVATLREALGEWFELGQPVPGAYLHRWDLAPSLRDPEEQLIASGELPATGARLVGVRRQRG
jgi:SAM-dependent methyltransferase